MAVVLDLVAGSPRLSSTTLKPTSWAFTVFADIEVTRLGAVGGGIWRAENATVVQRIEMRWDSAGVVTVQKRDSLAATTTLALFTDAALATAGRMKIALASDGTNAWAIYQRANGDVVKSSNLGLGTMSLAPETVAVGGIFAGGSFDGRGTWRSLLMYDSALGDDEIYWQLFAGLSPDRTPLRTEGLLARAPFQCGTQAGVNLATATDFTITGVPGDAPADPRPIVRPSRYMATASASPPAAPGNPLFFGMGV